MTVSGVNQFNLTRDQIILMAFEEIGVATLNRAPTNAQNVQAQLRLNAMIKHWKAKGINLWKSNQGVLFVNPNQASYILDGQTANASTSFTYSTVSTNALSGASSIVVTDPTQFTSGYFIGIMQDNNTSLWTTISSIVGSTINLASPLTYQSSANEYVYCYQSKIYRPENISALCYQNDPTTTQIPNVDWANNTYYTNPAINQATGFNNSYYYNKQLNYGVINLWPIPVTNTGFCNFTWQSQFYDFVNPLDTPDFPEEWLRAIYLNLAVELLRSNGKNAQDYPDLLMQAKEALQVCEGYDREDVAIRIEPASIYNQQSFK